MCSVIKTSFLILGDLSRRNCYCPGGNLSRRLEREVLVRGFQTRSNRRSWDTRLETSALSSDLLVSLEKSPPCWSCCCFAGQSSDQASKLSGMEKGECCNAWTLLGRTTGRPSRWSYRQNEINSEGRRRFGISGYYRSTFCQVSNILR